MKPAALAFGWQALRLRPPSSSGARQEALLAIRASISSFVATAVDGGVYMLVLWLVGSRWGGEGRVYQAVTALGAACGALTNFSLNRWWAFGPSPKTVVLQGAQYLLGSLLTLAALELAMWVLVSRFHVGAAQAWVPAKGIVWIGFSYPFQRVLVFRNASGGAK